MAPARKVSKTKFDHKVKQKRIEGREKQLRAAVRYFRENNCKGSAAISAGICPDIKDPRTIKKYLNGELAIGNEKEYCSVLTNDEEDLLVKYIKDKSRALQPTKRKDLNKVIIQMLKLRVAVNKKQKGGGRKYIPLLKSARTALSNGHAGRAFWLRFNEKHPGTSFLYCVPRYG